MFWQWTNTGTKHDFKTNTKCFDVGNSHPTLCLFKLKLNNHIKTITKSARCHLKSIARIKRFLSKQDTEKLVHAFIFSRQDYCNGVCTGLNKRSIRQLQLVQIATARVLTNTKKVEHIMLVLKSLHFLPVRQRIDLLICKALNGLGPNISLIDWSVTKHPDPSGHQGQTQFSQDQNQTRWSRFSFLCSPPVERASWIPEVCYNCELNQIRA